MPRGAMKLLRFATFLSVACFVMSDPVFAGDKDPLFVNVTTDDAYRSVLAITVSKHMSERGQPLTVFFFNDRGILVTSKENGGKFKEQQAVLSELAKAGATLIACPICMKH